MLAKEDDLSDPEGWDTLEQRLLVVRTGELVRQASRHEIGLRVFSKTIADVRGFSHKRKRIVRKALARQALRAGLMADGYDARLKQIVCAYSTNSENAIEGGLILFAILEEHGFAYDDWLMTRACIAALESTLSFVQKDWITSKQDPVVKKALNAFMDVLKLSTADVDERVMSSDGLTMVAESIVHAMAMTLGWNCQEKENPSAPITSHQVLISVVLGLKEMRWLSTVAQMLLRRRLAGTLTISTETDEFIQLIQPFHRAHLKGLSDDQFKLIREQHGVSVLYGLCELIDDHGVKPEMFDELQRAGCMDDPPRRTAALLERWQSIGSPKSLREFREAGGTSESWAEYVESDRQRREAELSASTRQRLEMQRAQRGTGRKRHHRSHRGTTPTHHDLDFENLYKLAQERLSEHLPEHANPLAAITLVGGLCRQGDRVVKAHEACQEPRKIWRNARADLTPLGVSQRQVKSQLDILVKAGVLERQGKALRLNQKRHIGNPAVRTFLTAFRSLIDRAAH
jgi:hypothetical protein